MIGELIFEGIIGFFAAVAKGFESKNRNVRLLCFGLGTNLLQLFALIFLLVAFENPSVARTIYFLPFLIGAYLAYFHKGYSVVEAVKYIFVCHILPLLLYLSCQGCSDMSVL